MFEILDVVRLKADRPDIGVNTEHVGAIVDIAKDANFCIVEFYDDNNETIEASLETYISFDELQLVLPHS